MRAEAALLRLRQLCRRLLLTTPYPTCRCCRSASDRAPTAPSLSGEMHDATEAHEALLDALHRAVASDPSGEGGGGGGADAPARPSGGGGDAESDDDSFVKRVFSMRMRMTYAESSDPKEEPSKPVDFEQWTQYVLASELRAAVRERDAAAPAAAATVAGDPATSPLLRVLRKETGADTAVGGPPPSRKIAMLRPPRVFTLGLASDTAHATKGEISESLEAIEERLNLRDVYDGVPAGPWSYSSELDLVALTAFYEQHYVCFVKSAGNWIHYDDNSRQVVGPNFADVKEKCVAGRLHPNALFFSNES